jgi:hypothetical protein
VSYGHDVLLVGGRLRSRSADSRNLACPSTPDTTPQNLLQIFERLLAALDHVLELAQSAGDDELLEWIGLTALDAADVGEQLGMLFGLEAERRRAVIRPPARRGDRPAPGPRAPGYAKPTSSPPPRAPSSTERPPSATFGAWGCGLRTLQERWIDTTTPIGEAMFHITIACAGLD